MVHIGSAVFRLLIVASFSVHLFACMFFRVKVMSAVKKEDVVDFYSSRGIDEDVSLIFFPI